MVKASEKYKMLLITQKESKGNNNYGENVIASDLLDKLFSNIDDIQASGNPVSTRSVSFYAKLLTKDLLMDKPLNHFCHCLDNFSLEWLPGLLLINPKISKGEHEYNQCFLATTRKNKIAINITLRTWIKFHATHIALPKQNMLQDDLEQWLKRK